MKYKIATLLFFAVYFLPFSLVFGQADILTPEENLWLKSRNNTLIVFPEKNFPPFSYQSSAGLPQGLSIDYIELIAEKIGARISYLPARSLSQIVDDVQSGKGDIITSLAENEDRKEFLLFTDYYISVPAVIVERKDLVKKTGLTPADFNGKRVAVGHKYAAEYYLQKNYPRVIVESVTDDEAALQLVVLGEVDAAVMDIASLSFYLSKQVLNSVRVVGETGFSYQMAFAVPKDKEILQSILDKALLQISKSEREIFNEKWIANYADTEKTKSIFYKIFYESGNLLQYVFFVIGGVGILLFFFRKRSFYTIRRQKRQETVSELREEMRDLEDTSKALMQELEQVKNLEQNISEKIKEIKD